ncbi:MAG TPA: ornithine cyclodeaminase family protein [Alphaproteobacteria bacterium]|nr:ornithine cyclodeaminase family protein [Alphaproteobacteria bacterium]
MTLILSNEEVEAALSMADCLAVSEDAYKALGRNEAATGVRGEILSPTGRADGLHSLLTMAGVIPGFGIGAVRINSDILTWPETAEGLRREKVPAAPGGRYVGLVLLFSTETGEPLAIYPDGIIQRMRVGAACGLAAKKLARSDARILAILGAGWQAGGQAMAAACVRDLQEIRCFSPTPARREAFATEWSERLGIEVRATANLEDAIAGADIVACATNSMQPVLRPDLLEPGMHVSSVKRLELPPETVARADVVFTHVTGAESRITRVEGADLAEDTDRAKARMTTAINQAEMPTLPDLLLDRAPGRTSDTQITMFLNYAGLGFQFAATGAHIIEKAKGMGLGREIPTDWLTSDLPS